MNIGFLKMLAYTKRIPKMCQQYINNIPKMYPNISKLTYTRYTRSIQNTKAGPARPWYVVFILYILYSLDIFGYMFGSFVGLFLLHVCVNKTKNIAGWFDMHILNIMLNHVTGVNTFSKQTESTLT